VRLISRIATTALMLAFGPRLTVVIPTWLTTVVLLLAYIGIGALELNTALEAMLDTNANHAPHPCPAANAGVPQSNRRRDE
jgi:hypothetical protein